MAAPVLVVITPHKRPALEELPGIELVKEDFELTERGKKVRLKQYQLRSWGVKNAAGAARTNSDSPREGKSCR